MRKDEDGNISTDVYQKPTDTHPYLNCTSAHPEHLKRSIPYSQALRLRRICSSNTILRERIKQYSEYFVACGYKRQIVLNEMSKVLAFTQDECLTPKTRDTSSERTPIVITYNPYTTYIAEIVNRHWDFLKSKERLAKIFNQRPLVAYRKPKSIRNILVRSKFLADEETVTEGFCKPCKKPRGSWCRHINDTQTFKSTQSEREYRILHRVNCQSPWVIYMIECKKCNLQYIGKSETSVNIRLNNHRNHVKTAVNSCELTEHFLQNRRSHSFDNDIGVTVIEQIRKMEMTKDSRKELLRVREIFWQRKLNTIQPGGLNKRTG